MWWIPGYYESVVFEVDEKLVISKYGVFFQENQINVSKISLMMLTEGPLQRHLGTKHLHIHAAAMGTPQVEIIPSIWIGMKLKR